MNITPIILIIISLEKATAAFTLTPDLFDKNLSYTYIQNFDSLGQTEIWENDQTLPGWILSSEKITLSTGASRIGGFYNLGVTDTEKDRSLGSLTTTSSNTFQLLFQNNTGHTLAVSNLNYIGEQWKQTDSTGENRITFSYEILSNPINSSSTTKTNVSDLDYTPTLRTSLTKMTTALNGHNNSCEVGMDSCYWQVENSNYILFTWTDADYAGTDPILALNDVSIAFNQIPEPSLFGLLALGETLFILKRNRTIR